MYNNLPSHLRHNFTMNDAQEKQMRVNEEEHNLRRSLFGVKNHGNDYQILVIFHLYVLSREGEIMLRYPTKVTVYSSKEKL